MKSWFHKPLALKCLYSFGRSFLFRHLPATCQVTEFSPSLCHRYGISRHKHRIYLFGLYTVDQIRVNHFGLRCTESDCKHINQIRNYKHCHPYSESFKSFLQLTASLIIVKFYFYAFILESKTFVYSVADCGNFAVNLNYRHTVSFIFRNFFIYKIFL